MPLPECVADLRVALKEAHAIDYRQGRVRLSAALALAFLGGGDFSGPSPSTVSAVAATATSGAVVVASAATATDVREPQIGSEAAYREADSLLSQAIELSAPGSWERADVLSVFTLRQLLREDEEGATAAVQTAREARMHAMQAAAAANALAAGSGVNTAAVGSCAANSVAAPSGAHSVSMQPVAAGSGANALAAHSASVQPPAVESSIGASGSTVGNTEVARPADDANLGIALLMLCAQGGGGNDVSQLKAEGVALLEGAAAAAERLLGSLLGGDASVSRVALSSCEWRLPSSNSDTCAAGVKACRALSLLRSNRGRREDAQAWAAAGERLQQRFWSLSSPRGGAAAGFDGGTQWSSGPGGSGNDVRGRELAEEVDKLSAAWEGAP
jgi:hypothetical protein